MIPFGDSAIVPPDHAAPLDFVGNSSQPSLNTGTPETPSNTSTTSDELVNESLNCTFPRCGKEFTRSGDRRRHELTVHGPRGPCPAGDGCKKTFAYVRKDKFIAHVRSRKHNLGAEEAQNLYETWKNLACQLLEL